MCESDSCLDSMDATKDCPIAYKRSENYMVYVKPETYYAKKYNYSGEKSYGRDLDKARDMYKQNFPSCKVPDILTPGEGNNYLNSCPFVIHEANPCFHSACAGVNWSVDNYKDLKMSDRCKKSVSYYCQINSDLDNMCACWKEENKNDPKCIEYRKFFEKDRALMRRFQRLQIGEPTQEVCVKILKGIKQYYEKFHGCTITDEACEDAVEYSSKFIADKKLPDKAIDVIDSACARLRLKGVKDGKIDHEEIIHEISKLTGISIEQLSQKQAANLETLETKMKLQVFGQDEALNKVIDKILISRAGLKSLNKPVGSFLFIGPTGCGKTETARTLATTLGTQLIRFDMSEYQEKHSIAKLIGSPPGYVGYEDSHMGGGLFINEIEKHPHAVVLFDEVEKAHQDVTNMLLQVMDYGTVTGSNGKKADCRNIILILTSNLGAEEMERANLGFGDQQRSDDDDAVKRFFAPEFRNRLDAVIKFRKLEKETMKKIVKKFLLELNTMTLEKRVEVNASEEAIEYLVKKGFDDKLGARPLARIIDDEIKKPLSKMILFGELLDGGRVEVTIKEEKITLEYKKSQAETNTQTQQADAKTS